ncbi:MAG: inverse autotransporter beta domain-containing protein [Verrucomicrobiota bacterium]
MNHVTSAVLRTLIALTLSLSVVFSHLSPKATAGELIAPAAPAAVQEIPWGITGTAGGTSDDFYGGMELLFPLWFDGDTLLFLYPEVEVADKDRQAYSLGLGLRHYFEEWNAIAGVSAFWDITSSTYDNTYNGFGLSAEVLTKWVDARLNWYLVGNDQNLIDSRTQNSSFSSSSSSTSFGSPFAQGNQILQPTATTTTTTTTSFSQTFERFEAGMDGLDVEAGFLVPYFSDLTGGMELRLFAGYYTYDNPFGDDIEGFKARGELRVTKWLTGDIAYYEDEELFGGNVYGGARVHFPLGKLERPVHVGGGYVDTGKGASYAAYGKGGVAKAPVEFAPAPLPDDSIAYRLTENIIRTPRIITSESGFIENVDKRKESTETTRKTTRGQTVVLDDVVFVNNGPATDNGIAAGNDGPKKKGPATAADGEFEIAEGGAPKKKRPIERNPSERGTAENPVYTLQAGSRIAQRNYFETDRIWNVFAAPGQYNGAVRVTEAPVNFYGNINANGHMFNETNAELYGGFRARGVEQFSVNYFDIYGGLPRRDGFDRDFEMRAIEDGIEGGGGLETGILAGIGGIGIHATNVDRFYAKNNYIDTEFIGILADWVPFGGGLPRERDFETTDGIDGIGEGELLRRRTPAHFHIANNEIYSPIGVGILNGGLRQVDGVIKNNLIDPSIDFTTDFLGDFAEITNGGEIAEGILTDVFSLPGLGIGVLGTGLSDTYVNVWGNDIYGLVGIAGASTGASDVHIWADYNDIYSFIGTIGVSLGISDLTFDMVHNHFEPELFIPGDLIDEIFNIGFFPDLTIPGIGAAFVSLGNSTLNANLWDNTIDQALLGVGVASFGNSELNLYAAKNNINALIGIGGLAFGDSTLDVDLRHNYIAGDFPLGEFLLDLFNLPGFATAMDTFAGPVLAGLGMPEGNPLAFVQSFSPDSLPVDGLPVLDGLNLGLDGFALANGDETDEGLAGESSLEDIISKIRIPGIGVGLLGFNDAYINLNMENNFIDPIIGVGVGAFNDAEIDAMLEGDYVQALIPVAALAVDRADVQVDLWNTDLDGRLVLPLLGLNIPGINVAALAFDFGNGENPGARVGIDSRHSNMFGGLVNVAGVAIGNSEVDVDLTGNEMNGLINNLFLAFGDATIDASLTDNWMDPDFSLGNFFGESGLLPAVLGNIEIGDFGILPPLFPGSSIQDLISSIDVPGAGLVSLGFGDSTVNIDMDGNHIDPVFGAFVGSFGGNETFFHARDNHIIAGVPFAFLTVDGFIDADLYDNYAKAGLVLNGLGESIELPGIDVLALNFGGTQEHEWEGNTFWGEIGTLALNVGVDASQDFYLEDNFFENKTLGLGFINLGGTTDGEIPGITSTLIDNRIWAPGSDLLGFDGPGIGVINVAIDEAYSSLEGQGNYVHARTLGFVNWTFAGAVSDMELTDGNRIHVDGFNLLSGPLGELGGLFEDDVFPEEIGISAAVWNQAFGDDDAAFTRVEDSYLTIGEGDRSIQNAAIVNLASGDGSAAGMIANDNEIKAYFGHGLFSEASGFDSFTPVSGADNWVHAYDDGFWVRATGGFSGVEDSTFADNMITAKVGNGIKLEAIGNNGQQATIRSNIDGNAIYAGDDGVDWTANGTFGDALIVSEEVLGNTIKADDDGFDLDSISGGEIEVNPVSHGIDPDNWVTADSLLISSFPDGSPNISGELKVNGTDFTLPVNVAP